MGRAGAAVKPGAITAIAAGAAPAALRRYDYDTTVYYDEAFAPPTWAIVTPRTLAPLAPQALVGGQPPAGERGSLAADVTGTYIYDTGAAWAAV